ncbi:ATP-dependent DNA helicase [soil metagenome]
MTTTRLRSLPSGRVVANPSIQPVSTPEEWASGVADTDGRQLILAGPGTGKTQFLAERVARLITEGTSVSGVAVLTFSRRAAAELEGRISRLLDRPASGAVASTFHGFSHRLVESDRAARGEHMPILLTGPEQVRAVAELLATEDPLAWPLTFRGLLESDTLAEEVADFVMRCHERLVGSEHLAEMARDRADWRALPAFYERYRSALFDSGRIDYGILIAEATQAAGSLDQFTHVVVDEFQDTSPAHANLAESLARPEGNITVATDPNQSIYAFRGAEVDNVNDFYRRADALTYSLSRSFRVPAEILASALRLVAPNPAPVLPHSPITPAPHPGAVSVHMFDQRSAEAEWIASEVERLHISDGIPLDSMAVILRSTRHLLPELSRALDRRSIPHDRPNTRLVDHPAIRIVHDAVVAASSSDTSEADLAMRRLLLGPLLTVPLGQERHLSRLRRTTAAAWPDLIAQHLPQAAGLTDLLREPSWTSDIPAVDGFFHLWDRLPGLVGLVADPGRSGFRMAWSTFARSLARLAERDPSVSLESTLAASADGDFDASPLLSFTRSGGERLVVTTLHQAKGLEFDVVFIADAVEGVFPTSRRPRSLLQAEFLSRRSPSPLDLLAEERRLAYTATTRARRQVTWTATTAGIDEGDRRPSRFLLAAAGVTAFTDLPAPVVGDDSHEFAPLTIADAESQLRRILADARAGDVRRLAALHVLSQAQAHWSPEFFSGVASPGPDQGLVGTDLRLSPSQATAYEECPRRYALERRVRAVEGDSPHMRFGSLVHQVLEAAEAEATGSDRPRAELGVALAHLDRVWGEADFGSEAMNDAWRRRAAGLLERLYSSWPGVDEGPIALEVSLPAAIGGVEWVGRADRVDPTPGGGLKVIDYKTSKTPPPLKEAGRSLQLGYYVLASSTAPALAAHGPPTGAELWYPLSSRARSSFPFDMTELGDVRLRLEAAAAGITDEDWSPQVGAHCDRCPVRLVCPAWPDGREGYR